MAEIDDLVRIQQAHHSQLLAVRETAADLVEDAWIAYANLDDVSAARFTAATVPVVDAARARTTTLAHAYMRANDRRTGHDAGDALRVAVPEIRGGIPTQDVYRRSIIEARRLVSTGTPYDQAMNAGRARAMSTARTDVILTNKGAIAAGADARPWVVGYRRVLTGKSCALCASASTQRYRRANLQPIHVNCDCDVAEIIGTEDPGQVVNNDLLSSLQEAGAADGRPDYWNGPYVVEPNGSIHYAKRETVRTSSGEIDRLPSGRPKTRVVPGERLVPEIETHGEVGPMLTDARHRFTRSREVRPTRPATSTTVPRSTVEVPPKVTQQATATNPRIKPTDPSSNSVQREALRRNVSAEQVAAERDAAKIQKALERRAETAAKKARSVESPEVIAAAERHGVTPDEILSTIERVPGVRRDISEAAARTQAEAFQQMEQFSIRNLQRPPARGAVDASGNPLRTGSWDFLEVLDERERARLSRKWYSDSRLDAPDQITENISAAGRQVGSIDEAMRIWLDLNRQYEAAGAIRRGKVPSARAYSGAVDLDNLADTGRRFRVSDILEAADDLDAAGVIARAERDDAVDYALDLLGQSTTPQHGPSPYRMSFQAWEEEVRTLEYGLREFPGEMPSNARARLAELVPDMIDEPGLDFEDLYARIVSTARLAGEEVPDYARIPWQ